MCAHVVVVSALPRFLASLDTSNKVTKGWGSRGVAIREEVGLKVDFVTHTVDNASMPVAVVLSPSLCYNLEAALKVTFSQTNCSCHEWGIFGNDTFFSPLILSQRMYSKTANRQRTITNCA